MRERPIIFGGESVRAILAGKKTQTRRVVSFESLRPESFGHADVGAVRREANGFHCRAGDFNVWSRKPLRCPYGVVGDRLWVRETWRALKRFDVHTIKTGSMIAYEADANTGDRMPTPIGRMGRKRSPLFMPRWASRLTLEVTEVRVERLQSISEEDAKAEGKGVTWGGGCFHRSFAGGWDALNAKRGFSWESNPWVWAVSFRPGGD